MDGPPISNGWPCDSPTSRNVPRERVTVLEPLLKQALSEHGDRELVADCDVTDAPVLELLNQFGFQPTGTPPYVEHGRTVEWVMGYMDASEAKVDLCRPGDASPE